jgi:hypothetical protein
MSPLILKQSPHQFPSEFKPELTSESKADPPLVKSICRLHNASNHVFKQPTDCHCLSYHNRPACFPFAVVHSELNHDCQANARSIKPYFKWSKPHHHIRDNPLAILHSVPSNINSTMKSTYNRSAHGGRIQAK